MDRRPKNQRKLSRAIQNCILDIVDEMPFRQSEIPDRLIQDGCITEDECREIRERPCRKDQVRKVILLIKGRNFEIMERYLDAIKTHCPAAVKKVWTQYNIYIKDKTRQRKCPFCKLKEYVDVKYVIDFLYGKEVIETNLYTQISDSNHSTAHQDVLWDLVIQACAGNKTKYLIEALKFKGHYTHIAESLKTFSQRRTYDYTCCCNTKEENIAACSFSGNESGSSTTYSPRSSTITNNSSTEEDSTTLKLAVNNNSSETIHDRQLSGEFSVKGDLNSNESRESVETVIAVHPVDKTPDDGGDERHDEDDNHMRESQEYMASGSEFRFQFLCFRCCKRNTYEIHTELSPSKAEERRLTT